MPEFLSIAQTVVSILLVLSILAQNRGTGLSATFGGTGDFYVEKRGAEKVLYNSTLVLSALFVGLSLVYLFV
jgi:protein translocase SecG subunit